jgi:hypothetical protein
LVKAERNLEKFQNLLREIFQFESSDLDFGIYTEQTFGLGFKGKIIW